MDIEYQFKWGEAVSVKRLYIFICLLFSITILSACGEEAMIVSRSLDEKELALISKEVPERQKKFSSLDLNSFDREPKEWGESVSGVKTRLKTEERQIALTFDACGGDYGNGYDEELILFLIEEQIPATLFINYRWIDANEDLFMELASNPLFQIENHGTSHAPLSVNGGEAWGIPATESPHEVYDEIMTNHEKVQSLTERKMTLFRSGTAFYDEIAVELANALGYKVVNFDILGDAGATYSSEQVKEALMGAQPGSIALLHMNQPQSETAEGVKQAVPLLQEKGFEFVLLKDSGLE